MDRLKTAGLVTALASISLLAGCFASNPEDIQAWVKPYEVNVTAENYVVEPPDELEIHCSQIAEVNMQRQRVRPDGKISFEVIGEVDVAGKTPKEISNTIAERLADVYKMQEGILVDVRVAVFASKNYYVVGQVTRPGPRDYTGRDSVLTALAGALPNALAWEERVQVIRPAAREDEEPRIFEVNYLKMVSRGDATKNVLLEEGDIVYVPPTILASIGMVLEEFISPVARAFYGAYLLQNPPTNTGTYSPYGGSRY